MADFCKQCSMHIFGDDFGDLANIAEENRLAKVLCEGCGHILVNREGICTGIGCLKRHNTEKEEQKNV